MKTKQVGTTEELAESIESSDHKSQGFEKHGEMTREESDLVRRVFGKFVVSKGASYSDSKTLHVPMEEDVPLCDNISSGPSKSGFKTKDESIFPHGYVENSGYKYCGHCTRIIREDVCLVG